MERVSWFCRDHHDPSKGDGTAEIIFSNRRRMSYADIQDYWRLLRDGPHSDSVRIEWKHISPDKISAINHDQLAGLQIADCVASAYWHAVTIDKYGNNEPRYCLTLSKFAYRFSKSANGYGCKFWPDIEELKPSMPHLLAFDGF
jgi:hypothetical protein